MRRKCITEEERKAYRAAWRRIDRSNNPEKYAEIKVKHYNKNKAKILENMRKYHELNSSIISDRKKTANAMKTKQLRKHEVLSRLYGINIFQYNEMYSDREGRCDICCKYEDVLSVDHCHVSGKIRGLLCQQCNNGLGLFYDNTDFLRMAALYLENKNSVVPNIKLPTAAELGL